MKWMRFFIYLRKYTWSPFFAKIEKATQPALFDEGIKALKEMKEKCTSVTDYLNFLVYRRFRYSNDPFKGALDYVSYPEITAAKKFGDCDDFAELALEVLKDHFEVAYRLYTFSGIFKGHVMVLLHNGHCWQLISNKTRLLWTNDGENIFERAAKAYCGEDLKYYFLEKIK